MKIKMNKANRGNKMNKEDRIKFIENVMVAKLSSDFWVWVCQSDEDYEFVNFWVYRLSTKKGILAFRIPNKQVMLDNREKSRVVWFLEEYFGEVFKWKVYVKELLEVNEMLDEKTGELI